METMDLAVLQNKLTTSQPSQTELKKLASETTQNILIKIKECSESIAESKEAADDAKNRKIGWFGIGSKKKINATSEALVQTNKAIAEMNNVVQESIKFTCVSYAFAEIMRDTLQIMIVQGFKDTDGRMVRLNENGREAAELVLQETESFAIRQKEQEAQLSRLNDGITQNAGNIAKNASKIDENRGKIETNAEHITQNAEKIGTNASKIDENRSNIEANAKKIEELEKISNKRLIIVLFILAILGLGMGTASLLMQVLK